MLRPLLPLLEDETFIPLAPLPPNSTTAQPVYMPIDYRVLYHLVARRLWERLDYVLPNDWRFDPNLVEQIQALLPPLSRPAVAAWVEMRHCLDIMDIVDPDGTSGVPDEQTQVFELFFQRPKYIKQNAGRLCKCGRIPWHHLMQQANNLQNVDVRDIIIQRQGRGIYRLDRGVLNQDGLALAIAGDEEAAAAMGISTKTVGVDEGIIELVVSVDADIQQMLNQIQNAPEPELQRRQAISAIYDEHVVQVSHGAYRQRSYSKKLQRLEEDFRDNDPRLSASFNALAANFS
ncbi:hypothetical protein HDV05_003453 [Chytridiales sp. JEL 0842]|nr:hypothetical protein HDV05_003453 [Chytridiales sp. JEL 0842]